MSAQIVVFLENRPGALSELADVLASAEVNIEALLLEGSVDFGSLRLHVSAPRKAEKALREAGYQFRVAEALTLKLSNEPGALADATKRLAKAKINIEALFGTTAPGSEEAEFVLMVSDVEKARKALGLDKQA
ncbi:MAG TPA: ACT domain-containing protein [Candidatus Thermoplasmatota archaeon]|nr:ACT domain-containing protein [Candidatus Thermoplasmatota archaeon]